MSTKNNELVIAVWDTPDDDTIARVFSSWENAEAWRKAIAVEHWECVFESWEEFDVDEFWLHVQDHGLTIKTAILDYDYVPQY